MDLEHILIHFVNAFHLQALDLFHVFQHRDLAFVRLSHHIQRLVGFAVKRITFHQRLQAGYGSRVRAFEEIKTANAELALGDNFLHLQQPFSGFPDHLLVVGILHDHLAIFLLGANGVGEVAVGLFHLLVMDIGDFHLGLGGFRHVGKEGFKVLIFLLRLRQTCGTAFRIP